MNKGLIGVGVIAIIAAGYGAWTFLSRPVDVSSADDKPVEWSTMTDGSFVARAAVGGFSESLTRCWPSKDGFECVRAAQMSSTINVTAADMKTLPKDGRLGGPRFEGSELVIPDTYNCEKLAGFGRPTETIIGHGERLASTYSGWSKDYVSKYLADNGINAKWFDCVGLSRRLEGGSYATLGTTSVTRKMVFH